MSRVFSTPEKLQYLCKGVNLGWQGNLGCTVNHQNCFVDCTEGIAYCIPLIVAIFTLVKLAGVLKRLKEQDYVDMAVKGNLMLHCDCQPELTLLRSIEKVCV